jgi:glutamate mutase epsilon subunit
MKAKKVYIVVTYNNDGDCDLYSDVIGVYASDNAAENLAEKLTKRKSIRGIDYNALQPFDGAAVLVFDLGRHINNKD